MMNLFYLLWNFFCVVLKYLKPREFSSELSNNAEICTDSSNSGDSVNSKPQPELKTETDSDDPDYIPPSLIKKKYFLRKRKN